MQVPAPFEVRIEAAPKPRVRWPLIGLGVLGVASAVWMPRELGLSLVLPALFAWLGLRVTSRKHTESAHTVRFLPEVLEVEGSDYVARTAWQHIQRAEQSESQLVLHMPSGGLVIPRAQLTGGLESVVGALPAHVHVETVTAPTPDTTRRRQARTTLLLWGLLIALFVASYLILGAMR
jgi:hypothetical protein